MIIYTDSESHVDQNKRRRRNKPIALIPFADIVTGRLDNSRCGEWRRCAALLALGGDRLLFLLWRHLEALTCVVIFASAAANADAIMCRRAVALGNVSFNATGGCGVFARRLLVVRLWLRWRREKHGNGRCCGNNNVDRQRIVVGCHW